MGFCESSHDSSEPVKSHILSALFAKPLSPSEDVEIVRGLRVTVISMTL